MAIEIKTAGGQTMSFEFDQAGGVMHVTNADGTQSHVPISEEKILSLSSENRLTDTVIAWLEFMEWEERPEWDKDNPRQSTTNFGYHLSEEFSIEVLLEANEDSGLMRLYAYYFDSKIPQTKFEEVMRWVGMANMQEEVGVLQVIESQRLLRYHLGVDFLDCVFEEGHIMNMLAAALRTMKHRLPQFMGICFGGMSAVDALTYTPEKT